MYGLPRCNYVKFDEFMSYEWRTIRLSKSGASALSLQLLILLALISAGCSGSGSHPPGSSAPSPQTPPFNTGEGEGNLVGTPSVLTYATGTSSAQTGLDTFYSQTVCPSELSSQNCSTNQTSLNTAQFGDFNLNNNPIANNSLGIKQVDAVKVDYTAINIDQTPVTVSGGIAVPQIAPAQIKGLILYFHGTTTQRTNVPSEFAPISPNSSYTDGTLLAAVWASQGYIVVMPDYIGLGDDTTHAHPYVVYPNQNAQSGLAMVLAARTLLAKSYQVNGALPLFITGYSEGGAYALEAGHLMQNNSGYASQLNVQLKKVAPMSGFFDLSGTGLAYLFYNISNSDNPWYSLDPQTSELSKPFLTAYLVLSFAQYAGIPPTDMLASPFYTTNYVCLDTLSDNLSEIYFTDTQFPSYDAAVLAAADCQAGIRNRVELGADQLQQCHHSVANPNLRHRSYAEKYPECFVRTGRPVRHLSVCPAIPCDPDLARPGLCGDSNQLRCSVYLFHCPESWGPLSRVPCS